MPFYDNPNIRFGTFAGKNLALTSLVGTAQLAPKNQVGQSNLPGGRQYGTISKEMVEFTPEVSPGQVSKGTSSTSAIVTTTNPIGARTNPTLGDTPVSHVTPEPVFITPEQYSREQKEWEGNVTWNTVPKTIRPNLIQKIVPQFGLSPSDSVNGNVG